MILERQSRVAVWGIHDFVLGAGEQAVRGYAACYDTAAHTVVAARTSANLILIGTFLDTMLGDGAARVSVEMIDVLDARWYLNDTIAPVALVDRWKLCYIKDGQTVSGDSAGRSVAGRVLDVAGLEVLVISALASLSPTSAGSVPSSQNKRMPALATFADGDLACASGIAARPAGFVSVAVNGVELSDIGDGTKVAAACYFSADGGATARAWLAIDSGDELYWQGSEAGYELSTDDEIDFLYEEQS